MQILIGPRATASNHLARNGNQWTNLLSQYNSGTANKEWNVIDVGKFEHVAKLIRENPVEYNARLKDMRDLLWVAEQIPGQFVMGDETELLKTKTYWASYGLPFYDVSSKAI